MKINFNHVTVAALFTLTVVSYSYANNKEAGGEKTILVDIAEERIKAVNEKKEEKNTILQTFTNFNSLTDPNVFLNEIELSPYSTRVQLTISPTNFTGAYCLWDIGDPSAYRLVDVDTDKVYQLEKQVSPLLSCNKNEWYQLFRNETAEIQLFFPHLEQSVKNIRLIEGIAEDEQTSAQFSVVQLDRQSHKQ